MKFLLNIFFVICSFTGLYSQSSSDTKPPRKNPMIMVVPFAKEGEDLRKVLEDDIARRVALIKVKEAFDNRGYSTVDFLGKLKSTTTGPILTGGTQTDIKRQIIELSGADIYVDVEVFPLNSSTGNSVRLNLTAYDAFTGTSLANKTGGSPKIYTDDFSKLTEKALESKGNAEGSIVMLEEFLNTMQSKFDDIVENGRLIRLQFVLDGNATVTFDDELKDGKILSDALEDWVSTNAYKNSYSDPRMTSSLVQFDEVRIPLFDEETKRNFTPAKFATQILQFCNKLTLNGETTKLKVKRDIQGGTIFITFQ